MIKILLYLSLLLASGITAGEGVASVDDNPMAAQYGFCDQGDSEKIDCDDQEDSASLNGPETINSSPPLTPALAGLVPHYPSTSSRPYLIRAPPVSH